MSEPQQPPVPPAAQPHPTSPPAPPAAHLPAAPQYPAVPQHPAGSNPLGRTAFVIAVLTLAINLFSSVARPFVYSGGDGFEIMLAIDNGIGILSFLAYVAALVLGLIAVRRAAPQLLTGIAIGIAGAGAIGLAFSGLTIGLYQYL
ncbi:hypothetical protein [Microbacterium sp. MYb66]|uniref:hypothetical protein n=1 Tax=Microbacterium sp. MYb66 TaxID=1848692 RepID=UPI000CFF52B5|nr:hypothetical protein [Microbacterium sp. MYb66]PRA78558.1 hypothetical protein CQ045_18255 [Microbacterium sp. MYb66]